VYEVLGKMELEYCRTQTTGIEKYILFFVESDLIAYGFRPGVIKKFYKMGFEKVAV